MKEHAKSPVSKPTIERGLAGSGKVSNPTVLKLKDVVSRGIRTRIAEEFLPIFAMLDHELTLEEAVPRWGAYDAQVPHTLLQRAPAKHDLVLCEVELQVTAYEVKNGQARRFLYSIRATAGVIYRLTQDPSDEQLMGELKRRPMRHARGFLRNRVLEEAASMRLPAIPFQHT
jgi:hypothetical protein